MKPRIVPSLWFSDDLDKRNSDEAEGDAKSRHEVDQYDQANLIGSRHYDGSHAVFLDLDCPHEYRPSSTPGHGHLVISPMQSTSDRGLPWEAYEEILEVLAKHRIIEYGYLHLARARKQAFLRPPHIRKGDAFNILDAIRDLEPAE